MWCFNDNNKYFNIILIYYLSQWLVIILLPVKRVWPFCWGVSFR